ncbi:MAG: hypothetical protein ACRCXZ_05280 [Patescibacteria group bacterium]
MFKNYIKTNPYEILTLDWEVYNDFYYYLTLLEETGVPVEYLDFVNEVFLIQGEYKDRKQILVEELITMEIDNPWEFSAPENVKIKLISDASDEDLPKLLYFLDNPDKKTLPESFNPITHPEYFIHIDEDEEVYSSNEKYNDLLKKALDGRNNTLDARKINSALTTEQIVSLATNKLEVINSSNESAQSESIAENSTTENPPKLDSVTDEKLNNLLKSKNNTTQATQKPQFNLDDLLGE